MTITEKLQLLSFSEVHFHKEGVFWTVYEQSAFAVCKVKPYQPVKKFIKAVKQEVVSAGFPENAFAAVEQALTSLFGIAKEGQLPQLPQKGENHIVLKLEKPIDETEYQRWKSTMAASRLLGVPRMPFNRYPSPQYDHINHWEVIDKLKCFNLSHATPMECMNFLFELKRNL